MVKNGYYRNEGLNFAWDLGVSFLGIRNFAKINDKILRSRSKAVTEKGVSCFHVYRFWGVYLF